MDVRGVLAGAALFSAASAAELDQLAAMAASRRVARGGLLFAEGEQAEQVPVMRRVPECREQLHRERVRRIVGKSEPFTRLPGDARLARRLRAR